jgi:hypothetical protein
VYVLSEKCGVCTVCVVGEVCTYTDAYIYLCYGHADYKMDEDVQAVVVGWDRSLHFRSLTLASLYLRNLHKHKDVRRVCVCVCGCVGIMGCIYMPMHMYLCVKVSRCMYMSAYSVV